VQDIKLPVLWKLITTPNPLFRRRPSRFDVTREAGTGAVVGYDIALRRGRILQDFERLVRRDRVYGPSRVRHTWRIWVVGKRRPRVDIHAPICAERKYNQVAIEGKTCAVLKLQENARLMFDSRMFVRNYLSACTEWRRVKRELRQKFPKIGPPFGSRDDMRKLQETKVKLEAFVWEHRSVYEQAVPLQQRRYPGTVPGVGAVPIRSAFYKVLNRRYQAAHFWLTQVSGHVDWIGADLDDDLLRAWLGSPRARWFSVPWNPTTQPRLDNVFALPWHLVSMDVSASQTQIQGILLGDEDMERDAILSREPHKVRLAKHAWDAHEAEDRPAMSEAELALALKLEQRIFRRAALNARTDLVENHETALQLIAAHERPVESLKAQFRQGAAGLPDREAYGPLLVGYGGPDDKRLIEMMKNLWMVLGYGSSILDICANQKKNRELYGEGWRLVPSREERLLCAKLGTESKATTPDYHAILHVLCQVPGFQARETFLSSCRIAVSKRLHADLHAGIRMTDPLDGAEFEWNEPLADAVPLRLSEWDLMLVKPGYYTQPPKMCPSCRSKRRVAFRRQGNRWYCRTRECDYVWSPEFENCVPDQHGRVVLDDKKLRKMLAPCLIHLLDSLFASWVMLALAEDGVRDFVSVHDCWFAPAVVYREGREPEHGHVVLDRAIRAAGKPWFLGLEPVYKWMREYIGGEQIERAYAKWRSRRDRGLAGDETAWPYFYAVPSSLGEPDPPGADSPSIRTALGPSAPPALL
jgi:hypothetical protein